MIDSPAFLLERIRILRCAFEDCLIAMRERDHADDAKRLAARWPEATQFGDTDRTEAPDA